jgi:hypothetical protein
MSGLDPGLMTADIVLQTATKSLDPATNQEVLTWTPSTDQALCAQWLPAGSTEAWKAQQRLESYVSGVFRIYDLDTVEARPKADETRIVFNGRTYDTKPYLEVYDGGMVVALDIPVVARGE